MTKYPSFKMSKSAIKRAQAMSESTAKGLVGILHNMVRSAENPDEEPSYRKWCAGQAAVNSAYLSVRFPREAARMSRQWIGVYVDSDEDAKRLLAALPNLRQTIPSLDWETDFEQDDEDDTAKAAVLSGELAVLYTSANFGHDDIIEIREIYTTLTNVANRLRELAKRAQT